MTRILLAMAFMATGFGAQAMPQLQSKYLCKTPTGQTGILNLEVRDNKLFIFGLENETTQEGLPCMNMKTETQSLAGLKVSAGGWCDDRRLYVETGMDLEAGSNFLVKIDVTKTSETQAQIRVETRGTMKGRSLNSDLTLSCEK